MDTLISMRYCKPFHMGPNALFPSSDRPSQITTWSYLEFHYPDLVCFNPDRRPNVPVRMRPETRFIGS
jgi:hypothetical protein